MAFNPLTYLRESKAEFDKVIWSSKIVTIRLTLMVIMVSIIVGAYIAGLDAVFAKVAEALFR